MSKFWNHVVSKFWIDVEHRLITQDSLYFAGGTLMMDINNGLIAFNLDGKGFICHTPELSHFKNGTLYMPDHITDLVRKIYLDTKEQTEHYITSCAVNDVILPPNITRLGLVKFSWLKNKKKWRHNKRLRKKFVKNYYKYVPLWVIEEHNNISYYKKAANEILDYEDKRILSELKGQK